MPNPFYLVARYAVLTGNERDGAIVTEGHRDERIDGDAYLLDALLGGEARQHYLSVPTVLPTVCTSGTPLAPTGMYTCECDGELAIFICAWIASHCT